MLLCIDECSYMQRASWSVPCSQDVMPFRVLCAVRIWFRSSWWLCCTLLFTKIFALMALSHCKHDMGTLSSLNAETLERVLTPLFGRFLTCSAHGCSFMRLRYTKYTIQWNPSIMNTTGNQHFVPYSEAFQAVEHNVAMFSEHSLDVHWWGRLSRGYYYE